MTGRRLATVLLAVVAAVGLLGTPVGPTAPVEVRAAGANLDFTSDAQYTVQPEKRRVQVTVDLHVVVEYGLNLAEVASTIRNRVSYEVERLTGLPVRVVEVHIEDVRRTG